MEIRLILKKNLYLVTFCLTLCFHLGESSKKILLGLCEEPVIGEPVRLCCVTHNIEEKGVQVQFPLSYSEHDITCRNYTYQYYLTSYDIHLNRSRSINVQCRSTFEVTVYELTLNQYLETDYGTWICTSYFGLQAKYQWDSDTHSRFDEYQGYTAALRYMNAWLNFKVPSSYTLMTLNRHKSSNIAIWTPTNTVHITDSRYRIYRLNGTIQVLIRYVDSYDADTYWITVDTVSNTRIAKSLLVYEHPTEPVITHQIVSRQIIDNLLDTILQCDTSINIHFVNMLGYLPNATLHWVYSNHASGYDVIPEPDRNVKVFNINCSIQNLLPVGCFVNQYGHNTTTAWFDMDNLCSLTTRMTSMTTRASTTKSKNLSSHPTRVTTVAPTTKSSEQPPANINPTIVSMSLKIGLCEEPLVGRPVRLCCRTIGLGKSGVRVLIPPAYTMSPIECKNYTYTYYSSLYDSRLDKSVEVQCYTRYDVTVYAFTMDNYLETKYSKWKCESYSGLKVQYNWDTNSYRRFSEYQGYTAALNGTNVLLYFKVPRSYSSISLHRHGSSTSLASWTSSYSSLALHDHKLSISRYTGNIRVEIHGATGDDVDTYWLEVDYSIYVTQTSIARSLLLFDPPSQPVIRYQDLGKRDHLMDATFYCHTSVPVTTMNMLSYLPNVTYRWIYPNSISGYDVTPLPDGAIRMTNIDCSTYSLPPIGCVAMFYGYNTTTEWFIMEDLCSLPSKVVSLKRTETIIKKSTSQSVLNIILTVIAILSIVVGLGFFVKYCRSRQGRSCSPGNPVTSFRNWGRRRRGGDHPFEQFSGTEEDEHQRPREDVPIGSVSPPNVDNQPHPPYTRMDYPQPGPHRQPQTLSGEIHHLRRPPMQTVAAPVTAVSSPLMVQNNPGMSHIVPNVGTGGFVQVPVVQSQVNANAGHQVNERPAQHEGDQDMLPDFPEYDPLQYEQAQPPSFLLSDMDSTTFSINRNEQFAAEARLRHQVNERPAQHEGDQDMLPDFPEYDPLQYEQAQPPSFLLSDMDSTTFSINRNEQFAAEARLQLEALGMSLQEDALHIQVTRCDIIDDLLNFYTTMDHEDAKRTVYCTFIGEEGLDIGGVTRDVYTTFWQKAIPKYFTGNIALVPKLNLQAYDISTFVTLGRIFAHSTAVLKAIPIQICRSTLNVVIFGDLEMVEGTVDIVIEDFLLYVSTDDRQVLEKALTNYDALDQSEMMALRNIFASYDMPEIPSKENIKKNMSIIAHNELCTKSKVLCEQMGKGIPEMHRHMFWGQMTILHIDGLYEVFRPTADNVIAKLRCMQWPLRANSQEKQTFTYLKTFITNMSPEMLLRFLHFVTGERKIPPDNLMVEFTNPTGASRVPRAHTCSCLLELPKSYTRYKDLETDFLAVLRAEESFVFTQQ